METCYRFIRTRLFKRVSLAVLSILVVASGLSFAGDRERPLVVNRLSEMAGKPELMAESVVNLDFSRYHRMKTAPGFEKITSTGEVVYLRQVFSDGAWQSDERELMIVDAQGRAIEYIWQYFDDGSWQNRWRGLLEYEGDSMLPSVFTYQEWDEEENEWVNEDRDLLVFDENGNLIELIFEEWINDEWVPEDKILISYTDDGNYLQIIEYKWENDDWVPDYRLTWTYDDAGNEIELLEEFWDDIDWLADFRVYSEYENGNKILEQWQYYDDFDEDWFAIYQILYEYENGNNTVRITQQREDFDEEWENSMRTLRTFDAAGNVILSITQFWDDDEEDWRNSSRTETEYTAQGNESLRIVSVWEGEDWVYNRRRTFEYDNAGVLMVETIEDWTGTDWLYSVRHIYSGDDPTSVTDGSEVPLRFELMQNYPNPFNPTTTIQFFIPEQSRVTLTVYDLLGRKVATLVDEHLQAGEYSHVFDANHLASGVYIYRLQAGEHISMKRLTLVK